MQDETGSPEDPMRKWVQTEAAKHTTPASIRQRMAYEEKQILALASTGFGGDMEKARKTHRELIQVLSERLADFR
jgi:hypothetical protein